MNISIRQCLINELDTLQRIGYETFDETFRPINSPETMDKYLQEAFSMKKLSEELSSTYCKFYFMYLDNALVGYLKINDAPAQSDINDPESMEVERIYVRKRIGQGINGLCTSASERKEKELCLVRCMGKECRCNSILQEDRIQGDRTTFISNGR
jgi:hypothetical protein